MQANDRVRAVVVLVAIVADEEALLETEDRPTEREVGAALARVAREPAGEGICRGGHDAIS
jgi:hypothetical protein